MWVIYKILQPKRNRIAHSFFRTVLNAGSCLILTVILALSISACSISVPTSSSKNIDHPVTDSLEKTGESPNTRQTDAEIVKTIMTSSENPETDVAELTWSNPHTGNSGTIVAIENFVTPQNQKCKNFRSTINSFTGILLYDGQACETKPEFWTLSLFKKR